MRYEVPQFIDIKEKIVGPLTLAQFFYVAGGAGGAYICFRFLPGFFGILFAVFIIIFAGAMAFGSLNGRSFPEMLYAMFVYALSPKMYIWSYKESQKNNNSEKPKEVVLESGVKRTLSQEKIQDIAWGLDIDNHLS